jgi:chromosome partitioning protein
MSANTRPNVIDNLIAGDAQLLSKQLQRLREKIFPPESKKGLRRFSSGETAKLIGVSDSYLRQLSLNKQGPLPETTQSGRRQYTLEQVNALRRYIASVNQPDKQRQFLPHRAGHDHLQVIAVTNFKGGSGKTTTSVHLAQYLALRGYRVLAIDLDPQASLSSLLGFQPEFDLKANETLYGAVRYDAECRPLSQIIRTTYFDGLSVVPANLELHEFEHTTPRILAEGRGVGKDLFFARVERALSTVEQDYDVVVIDCPPQLGFLTLSALCAATSVLVTIHPQMLDVASMSQFLLMTSDLLAVVREAGGDLSFDFFRYVITRHETNDGPQAQIIGFMRSLFGDRVLTNVALKSTAISDAGLSKQTIYEVDREGFSRSTYQRAIESLDAVNGEIESLIRKAWRRE